MLYQVLSHRHESGNPIVDDLVFITQEQFDLFLSSVAAMPMACPTQVSSASTSSSSSPTTSKPSPYSPTQLFKRNIKRDPSLFPTLKDERFNDNWHRSFVTQARAQDVMDVLNPQYKPSTQDDKELFDEKQKYVFSILERNVLTDVGKSIVRSHENDYNAQEVYKKLLDHHLRSTKANIDSSAILSYITSAILGTGEWKGSTESFIVHWVDKVRVYERQAPTSDHFSDGQKRTMLENAVHGVDDLRRVKVTADLEKAISGKTLNFHQYYALVLAAAASYDIKQQPQRSKRLVYTHDISMDDGLDNLYENFDHDDSYDIDAPVTMI